VDWNADERRVVQLQVNLHASECDREEHCSFTASGAEFLSRVHIDKLNSTQLE